MVGLYEIVHLASGRAYVGSSTMVERRLAQHRYDLRRGAHCNVRLQRAWNRDGESAFCFRAIGRCIRRTLRDREAELLAARDKGALYNTSPVVRRGAPAPNQALSDTDALMLYMRAAGGESVGKLAKEFGVPVWTARRIVAGETYGHLTGGKRARGPMKARGESIHAGRLSAEQVLTIRARLAAGERGSDVASVFGVTPRTVYLIRDRKVWTHI